MAFKNWQQETTKGTLKNHMCVTKPLHYVLITQT